MGYFQAGFDVVGVDINPQPLYPFKFLLADVFTLSPDFLQTFDVIHASPPCQAYSSTRHQHKKTHPELIEPVRELLLKTKKPYIIENVEGAPLKNAIKLCGTMFSELRVYRHRLFETSFKLKSPLHPIHKIPCAPQGGHVPPGYFMTVAGHFTEVYKAEIALDIHWMKMDRKALSQAIPPAYTKYIGEKIKDQIICPSPVEI